MAGVPIYIVHLSSADALEKVQQARDMGLPAYAETCPQYLFLSYDNYEEPGFDGAKYVMSPPLREKWHQDVLWKGLAKNDLQVISTDHCPFCMAEQKELGKDDFSKIPNGAPGIETRLTLVHNGGVRPGRISLNRFVELCSTTPAKMFGLFPRKGTIAVGSDADIVVFDPEREADARRQDAAHECGLQPLRRHHRARRAGSCHLERQGDRRSGRSSSERKARGASSNAGRARRLRDSERLKAQGSRCAT